MVQTRVSTGPTWYFLSQNLETPLWVARTLLREVRDPSRGSGLYLRRSWTLP
jgi:hypothetical protein